MEFNFGAHAAQLHDIINSLNFATYNTTRGRPFSVLYLFQVNLFLNRLSGPSIGLTAMGMFVVDKPTILTVNNVGQINMYIK